jgi:hypothetical protein
MYDFVRLSYLFCIKRGLVLKRRIALLGVVALVMSMFGALPSRATGLVLTFPTAAADF